jgi:hypothetical protein
VRRLEPAHRDHASAWIIGNRPLVLAYNDSFSLPAKTNGGLRPITRMPESYGFMPRRADGTGVDEDGRVYYKDGSMVRVECDSDFVYENELSTQVNVVAFFQPELDLNRTTEVFYSERMNIHARRLVLREPRTLLQLMQAIAEPGGLDHLTAEAIEIKDSPIDLTPPLSTRQSRLAR